MRGREHYKIILPIIKAYSEGADVQFQLVDNGPWRELDDSAVPNFYFYNWRIKPELKKTKQWIVIYEDGTFFVRPSKEELIKLFHPGVAYKEIEIEYYDGEGKP